MDKLSLNDALLLMLVNRDSVDGTNALTLMRRAQDRLRLVCMLSRSIGTMTPDEFLNLQQDMEVVDDLIISATHNGLVDLFNS